MLTVYCPICEWEIETSDTDVEIICPQCGRLFTIDSGDACYSNKNKGNSHD